MLNTFFTVAVQTHTHALSQFGAANDNHWNLQCLRENIQKNNRICQTILIGLQMDAPMKESFFNWDDHFENEPLLVQNNFVPFSRSENR